MFFESYADRFDEFAMHGPKCILKEKFHRSSDSCYKNVKFIFPLWKPNQFHAHLGITSDNQVINASNSYIDDHIKNTPGYEEQYLVYARMAMVCEFLKAVPDSECCRIQETVCFFMTPFDSVNFGHNLSVVFDFIHQYRARNLTCDIVLSAESKRYPNIIRILELFFETSKLLFIDNDKPYLFSSIVIFDPVIFDISRHQSIIEECIERVRHSVSDHDPYKNKNILIIKNTLNQNALNPTGCFELGDFQNELALKKSWVIVQAETMSIIDIILYLQYANKIVSSFGSINYGHATFFSETASWFFLQATGEMPYFRSEKYRIVKVCKDLGLEIPKLRAQLGLDADE